MTQEKKILAKEYRIYKPNSKGSGAASKFQCRTKWKTIDNNDYAELILFLETASQSGVDGKGNASFNWSSSGEKNKGGSVTMKLGLPDIGEMLLVLKGRKKFVGPEPKQGRSVEPGLYHQNKNGNTSLRLKWSEGKLYLNISSQDSSKKVTKISHSITPAEAAVLESLLDNFIVQYHNWQHQY
tara:strand:+ start:3410 stop:3958 length:549 start_codon:yes stop_codon:yes gene_type:complete